MQAGRHLVISGHRQQPRRWPYGGDASRRGYISGGRRPQAGGKGLRVDRDSSGQRRLARAIVATGEGQAGDAAALAFVSRRTRAAPSAYQGILADRRTLHLLVRSFALHRAGDGSYCDGGWGCGALWSAPIAMPLLRDRLTPSVCTRLHACTHVCWMRMID